MTFLVRFTRRTGRVDKCMSAKFGTALMELWALQHTTKTKDTIIFTDAGDVVAYYEGTEDFPKVTKEKGDRIENYCPGLLEYMLQQAEVSE